MQQYAVLRKRFNKDGLPTRLDETDTQKRCVRGSKFGSLRAVLPLWAKYLY